MKPNRAEPNRTSRFGSVLRFGPYYEQPYPGGELAMGVAGPVGALMVPSYMVRGQRATSLGGRGEDSGRRFTFFSTPPPLAGGPTTSACLPLVAGPTTSAPLPLTTSTSLSQMASGSTPPPSESVHAEDEMSHHEGEGSYSETMQTVWINEGGIIDSESIKMSYVLDLHGQPLQEQISNIFCIMFEEMQKEFVQAQIRTRVQESYSRGMIR
ncbi:hypothetical protein Taro_023092, partial [Colocasia esculenta]|nr:hypothetical protein [Colocasia esculenta]